MSGSASFPPYSTTKILYRDVWEQGKIDRAMHFRFACALSLVRSCES